MKNSLKYQKTSPIAYIISIAPIDITVCSLVALEVEYIESAEVSWSLQSEYQVEQKILSETDKAYRETLST